MLILYVTHAKSARSPRSNSAAIGSGDAPSGCIFQGVLNIGLVKPENDNFNALFGLLDGLEH